jgi:hypothetical protein
VLGDLDLEFEKVPWADQTTNLVIVEHADLGTDQGVYEFQLVFLLGEVAEQVLVL